MGESPPAVAHANRLNTLGRVRLRARLAGDLVAAEKQLSDIPIDSPELSAEDRVRVLREFGVVRARQSRHQDVMSYFDRAVAAPSDRPEVEIERAEALSEAGAERYAVGDMEGAAASLESALQIFVNRQQMLTPARADALCRLARVRLAQHRTEDARRLLEEADTFPVRRRFLPAHCVLRGRMNKIPPEQWRQIFELLDTVLDLPSEQREAWLDALDESRSALQPALREILARRASLETGDFLSGLPARICALHLPPAAAEPLEENTMQKVLGIGGLFFKSSDPELLAKWYETHLGISLVPSTYEEESWQQEAGPTAFAPFKKDTQYFGRPEQSWMVNFRVGDLNAMIAQLRAAGITVEDPQSYPNGDFARLHDPDGNPIELWQVKQAPKAP